MFSNMTDFNPDFCLDPGIAVKQEPANGDTPMNTSASVPIPGRRIDLSDYRDYSSELENSQSDAFYQEICFFSQLQNSDIIDTSSLWSNRINSDTLKSEALIHMDDDDIFQVDKSDLIQGPTLAELNANDDTLGEINFDDILLPEENKYVTMLSQRLANSSGQFSSSHNLNNNQALLNSLSSVPTPMFYRELGINTGMQTNSFETYNPKTPVSAFSPGSQANSNSPILSSPLHMGALPKPSTLHELLIKREGFDSPERMLGQSVPGQNPMSLSPGITLGNNHISRLSSSAPTHLGPDQIWQRREPRKHLLSTSSLVEAESTSSLSTGGILSPDPQDLSHDELDSDEDSDAPYEDFSSDGDSDEDFDHSTKASPSSKKERYFWQYNVQAKGPKGQRLITKSKMEDPHVLNEVTDPVFSPDCSVRGIKHSGKARKGDGNDLTPNPRKLFTIGKELNKLSRTINDMTPVSELPFNIRPTSRKEKNKLASRACRLKKKAQHEANKIKLNGLETEHKRLLNGILQAKHIVASKLKEASPDKQEELSMHVDRLSKAATKIKIAGHTTEYVNKILDRIKGSGVAPILEDI